MATDWSFVEPSEADDENPALAAPREDLVDPVLPVDSESPEAAPRELVELKAAIEERLRGLTSQSSTGPRSVEDFRGLRNIQGLGLGFGSPSTGERPGKPSLMVFVGEAMTANQVRSLIAEATGIQIPQSIGLTVERTGLIEPQTGAGLPIGHQPI